MNVGMLVGVLVAAGGGSGVGVPLAEQASVTATSTINAAMIFLCINILLGSI